MRHFAQNSYSVKVHSHNGQLTLHTDSHASYSGAVRWEWRTILGAKSKLLYSGTTLSRKLYGIGHMHTYGFLLRITDAMTSQHINVSFWDILYIYIYIHTHTFSPLWRCGPTRAMASSFLRFLDHTQRRITVGRTPLDEWSVRRRDFYLTTHNIHNRQTSTPPVGFEPTISKGERP